MNSVGVTDDPGLHYNLATWGGLAVSHITFAAFKNVEVFFPPVHRSTFWTMKTIYENRNAQFKFYFIYKEIRQEHFLFYSSTNSEPLPNPTLGDSPTLQRREEVIQEKRHHFQEQGPRWVGEGTRMLPRWEEMHFSLPLWPDLTRPVMSTLITHTLNITKKVSEMILIHWDNSKGQNTVSLNPTLTLYPPPWFVNIHGRHAELWPGVKLLFYSKPVNLLTEKCFLFLHCWDSECLGSCGTWALSSILMGGEWPI